jgi:hypothetical protein
MDSARHIIKRILMIGFSIERTAYDVAGTIHHTLPP